MKTLAAFPLLGVWLQLVLAAASATDMFLVPIAEYSCDQKQETMSRQLVLQFASSIAIPWLMIDDDNRESRATRLEETVLETYNELSFQSCDIPHFRTLSSASMITGNADSNADEEYFQHYEDNYFLILQLEGYCRNCTDAALPLFDPPRPVVPPDQDQPAANSTNSSMIPPTNISDVESTPPPLSSSSAFSVSVNKKTTTKQGDGYCICPGKTSDTNSSSLTTSPELTILDFLVLLNTNLLRDLPLPAYTNDTLAIANLIELQEVSCSSQQREFTSFAYVDVELVDNKPPSTREIQALERSFVNAYNRLSFGSCDPYFRSIQEAKLEVKIDDYEDFDDGPYRKLRALRIDQDLPGTTSKNTSNTMQYLRGNSTLSPWGNITLYPWGNATLMGNASAANVTETDSSPRRETGNAIFTIRGLCRNCPVNAAGSFTLFDDAFGQQRVRQRVLLQERRKAEPSAFFQDASLVPPSVHLGEFVRRLQTAGDKASCVCPGQTTATPTPSTEASDVDEMDTGAEVGANGIQQEIPEGISTDATGNSENVDSIQALGPLSLEVTREDFLATYNDELEQLQEEGTVETIQAASDLEEGQNVQCAEDSQKFSSEVFSELQVDLATIGRKEVRRLETAFLESYNQLRFRTCDGLFRTIDDVELRIAPATKGGSGRRLRDIVDERALEANGTAAVANRDNINSTAHTPHRQLVPTLFAVTGACRDCAVSESGGFNLFDDAFRRRRGLQTIEVGGDGLLTLPVITGGIKKDDRTDCICAAGADPTSGEAPTASTFGEVLSEEVVQLGHKGKIDYLHRFGH